MITPDSNFIAARDKSNARPVWLAEIERDYQQARWSDYADWSAGTGDADFTERAGSLVCKKGSIDITGGVVGLDEGQCISDPTHNACTWMRVFQKVKLGSFKVRINVSDISAVTRIWAELYKVEDDIYNMSSVPSTYSFELVKRYGASYTIGDGWKNVEFQMASVELNPGKYLIRFWRDKSLDPGNGKFLYKVYKFNQGVVDDTKKGLNATMVQIGDVCSNDVGEYNGEMSYWASDVWTPRPNFDGNCMIRELTIVGYQSSSFTLPYRQVKNSSGVGVTPSASGLLRAEVSLPDGCDVTYTLYGDADGTPTGEVSLGAKVDGDTITAYNYYKVVVSLTTTKWWVTPELLAIAVYFKITEKICGPGSDSFGGYRPILSGITGLSNRVDPLTAKTSLSEFAITCKIENEGPSKSISWIEKLVRDNNVIGKDVTIRMGYHGLAEASFIDFMTGTIDDFDYSANHLKFVIKDSLSYIKNPLVIEQAVAPNVFFRYIHPVDVVLTLMRLSAVPIRFIDMTSATAVKNALSGQQAFGVIEETESDYKKYINEICELYGFAVFKTESGKWRFVNLNDETTAVVATFKESEHAKSVSYCNPNLRSRINYVKVQSGYYKENAFEKELDDNETWDTVLNASAASEIGIGQLVEKKNKWVPRDLTVNGVRMATIIGTRFTDYFGYGPWTMTWETDHRYAHIQAGDFVNIETRKILWNGIYGTTTRRALIIDKKPDIGSADKKRFLFEVFFIKPLLATAPTAAPTALVISNVTTSSIKLDWTASVGGAGAYIVLRAVGAYPNALPVDGNAYSVGDVIGNATVVAKGSGVTFTDSGLTEDTEYYYSIYAGNGTGRDTNWLTPNVLQGAKYTASSEPAAQPTSLVLTVTDNDRINAAYTLPTCTGVIALRRAGAAPTGVPADNQNYNVGDTIGDSTVAYIGPAASFDDAGLSYSTTYHYAIMAYNGHGATNKNYRTSTPLTGSKTLTIAEPTNQPTSLTNEYNANKNTYIFSFIHSDPPVTGYIVIQGASTPVDGTTYTEGQTISASKVLRVGYFSNFEFKETDPPDLRIYAYNGTGAQINYKQSSPLSYAAP